MNGHERLVTIFRGDVAVVNHVHRVVLDRVQNVLVGIPLEHNQVELDQFRKVIVPRGPQRQQRAQRWEAVRGVRRFHQVGEGRHLALHIVDAQPRTDGPDRLILAIALVPDRHPLGKRRQIVKESFLVTFVPVRGHGTTPEAVHGRERVHEKHSEVMLSWKIDMVYVHCNMSDVRDWTC